jgi:hypothetical protein
MALRRAQVQPRLIFHNPGELVGAALARAFDDTVPKDEDDPFAASASNRPFKNP